MAEQTGKVKDAAKGAKDKAGDAKDAAGDATGTLKEQTVGAFTNAAKDIIGPAFQQMSQQAAQQAADYAREQGPKLIKEQVLPQMMKSAGVGDVSDMPKAAIGKAGELLSGAGGITGVAGKLMGKLGGGKGGKKAAATGYGQGRRIMLQQHQYVPVNVKDAFRAWTESEWPEYMHRVNTLDRQIEEDSARYAIGIKGFWFKKNFTAQVQEQVPFKYIVWSTTQGNIKNTGRVSFFEQGEDLTLMILNLDMAPSGLREKWVRGFRYHKRGVRSDFHRFSAWLQMRTPDQLLDMEGWLGTIEGGKITETHEEYVEAHEEEQDRAEKAEEQAQDVMEDRHMPEDSEEDEETPEGEEQEAEGEDEESDGEPEEDEEQDEEDEEDDRPIPTPSRRSGGRRKREEPVAEEDDDEDDEEEEETTPRPRKRRSMANR